MASDDRGGAPPVTAEQGAPSMETPTPRIIEPDTSLDSSDSDESGSSYIGSALPSPPANTAICRWRTGRFHDQECEHFFDCPTHIVERSLSDAGDSPQGVQGDGGQELRQGQPEEGTQTDDNVNNGNPVDDNAGEGPSTRPSGLEGEARQAPTSSSAQNQHSAIDSGEEDDESLAGERVPGQSPLPPPRVSSLAATPTPLGVPATIPPGSSSDVPPPLRPGANFTRIEDFIARRDSSEPAEAGPSRPSPAHQVEPDRRANQERPAPPRDIVLPRWQPDSEVTFCPICRSQFSIFVRKHHCRKCGRVVCNSCSPHRIVIPYQFIVQPPGQPRLLSQNYPSSTVPSEGTFLDFRNVGGGERVRLCNPCVPDPNTTPPQTQGHGQAAGSSYSPRSPRTHHRSHSIAHNTAVRSVYTSLAYEPAPFPPAPASSSRNRSATVAGPQGQVYTQSRGTAAYPAQRRSREARILSGTPPVQRAEYLHSSEAEALRHMHQHGSLTDVRGGPSSAAAANAPRYVIAEEDECPVCHRELPSRNLPQFEQLRETHITMCIQAHSGGSSVGGGNSNTRASTTTTTTGTSQPPPGSASPAAAVASSSSSSGRRATGMFPYVATEKDCVDSAECTICLEEFEVGVPMARLECLCRFHRACILAWWRKHPGRCPVHQHDGFGF